MNDERILRKMDKLIGAINTLTVAISNGRLEVKTGTVDVSTAAMRAGREKVSPVRKFEQIVPAHTFEEITHETIKTLCLKKSRESGDNKPKVLAILKDLGAGKIKDLKGDDLEKAYTAIGKV